LDAFLKSLFDLLQSAAHRAFATADVDGDFLDQEALQPQFDNAARRGLERPQQLPHFVRQRGRLFGSWLVGQPEILFFHCVAQRQRQLFAHERALVGAVPLLLVAHLADGNGRQQAPQIPGTLQDVTAIPRRVEKNAEDRLHHIVGFPRSGTTLTEQILARHRRVFAAGELPLASRDFLSLSGGSDSSDDAFAALQRLTPEVVDSLARRHLEQLQTINATAERIVDKMPDNYFYLGLLATLFPRARFIHCRRDPRDTVLSCWMTHFRHIRWSNDFDHLTSRFHAYRRLMTHWRQVLPVPMLEIDYEETVADLEDVARRLVAWCGLEWQAECLNFHEARRPVRTASSTQVRQPLYAHSVGRWKHYRDALAPLFQGLDKREEVQIR
jgi:hypothetical protein